MDPKLLNLLQCPETKQTLHEVPEDLLSRINQKISEKQLRNRAGKEITTPWQQALASEDEKWIYPVVDGIPVMLTDESLCWLS